MLKEKSIAIIGNKRKIIGIGLYTIFLIIMFINFYTQLIHDETCGYKSKILFIALFSLVSVIIGFFIILVNKKDKIKPEKFFVIAGLTIGILYMFATPLFKGHDEQFHWYKSYAVSLGKFTAVQNEDGILGDYLPRMVNDVFETQGFFTGINYKTSIEAWKYSITDKEENNEKFTYNAPTAIYPPIQMIPQSIGIIVSRVLNFDTYSQAFFARLGNLCFFIIMGYFSIKIIPSRKNFLVALLLSPKIMYISSTMSGDVFTNSIIIFFISYIFKLRKEIHILNKKDLLILSVTVPCVAISKAIYIPVCMLLLLLPKECFKNKSKRIIIIISLLILAILTSVIWTKISNNIDFNTDGSTKASQQLNYVLHNPISYAGVLVRGICNNFITWGEDIVGGYMEWGSGLTQPSIISVIVYFAIFLALINDTEISNEKFKIFDYILISMIILIVCAGVLSAMYIQWTPNYAGVGGLKIIGVQGRYFVPIILLLSILLPTKYLESKNKINIKWIYIILLLCEVSSLLNIFVRNI